VSHLILSSSNWWEPGTSGIFDIGDLAAFFGLLIAGSTVVFGVTRWWMKLMRKMMVEEIGRATTQIQPTANGGLSLPDVARKTDALEKKVNEMHKDQIETKELIIKVLASAVIIPDTPPIQEPKARNRSKKTSQ
jgi:hypothetical protein